MSELIRDFRFAVRSLRRQPGLTAVAVAMLALGIGASTSVFTAADAVMFEMPFEAPERIVTIRERNRTTGAPRQVPTDRYLAWREATDALEAVAAYTLASPVLTDSAGAERLSAEGVSADLFSVLGARPLLGRVLLPRDERTGSPPCAVLSYRLWSTRFGSDPGILGRTIELDGTPTTVVGVMRRGFDGPRSRSGVQIWLPLQNAAVARPASAMVYALVKSGVTVAAAESRLDAIARALPGGGEWGAWLQPLTEDALYQETRSQLALLAAAVALVFLIACANVASLLLGRNVARRRDLAIRKAIGARLYHLLRQMIAESLLLSGMACVAGIFLTLWTISVMTSLMPGTIPRIEEMDVDGSVLLFAVALATGTALIVALLPGISTVRTNVLEAIKAGIDAGGARRAVRLRTLLVVAETSIALTVLGAAMLLIGSFLRLNPTRPGFALDDRYTFSIRLDAQKYRTPEARVAALESIAGRLGNVSGIRAVTASSSLPLTGSTSVFPVRPLDVATGTAPVDVHFRAVLPRYFSTMEIPVLRGREITERDTRGAEAVAVVTEAFARRYFPDRDALGARIEISEPTGVVVRRIVGIVRDFRSFASDLRHRPEVFVPYSQSPLAFVRLVLVAGQPPADFAAAIRRQVGVVDSALPTDRLQTMRAIAGDSVRLQRFLAWLMTVFAAIGLVLCWAGVYAMAGWSVSQRTREFAVRIAVGARPHDIRRIVLRYGLLVGLAGAAAGSAGAFASARLVESWVFGMPVAQPLWRVLLAASFVVITTVACYVPARRAVRVDPILALRSE